MKVTDEMIDGAIATFAAGGGFEPSEWDKVAWRAKMRDAITAALSHAAGQEAVACYGLRRKGETAIIGLIPEKVHKLKPTSEEFIRDYEEVPLYLAPINPAEIDRKLVGGEAVHQVSHSDDGVDYLWQDVTAEEHEKFSRLGVPVRVVYLTPAQPPASAEVGREDPR